MKWNAARAKRSLDKLWAARIKARDESCQFCGRTEGRLNAHHIFSRRHLATRWDLRNGVLICFTCHQRAHNDIPWGYEQSLEFAGPGVMAELKMQSAKPVEFDRVLFEVKRVELGGPSLQP